MREFFVIDGRGYASFNIADREPDSFASLKAATKRARELAKSCPTETVVITKAVAYVTCEVSPPKVELRERKLRGA